MNFSDALRKMKAGAWLARSGWKGRNMHIQLVEASPRMRAFIKMKTVDGDYVPWLASQSDLLTNDWVEVRGAY